MLYAVYCVMAVESCTDAPSASPMLSVSARCPLPLNSDAGNMPDTLFMV